MPIINKDTFEQRKKSLNLTNKAISEMAEVTETTVGKIKKDNLIIALPSSGIHSNGYSLVRYILKKRKINLKKNNFLKGEILKPTKIYVKEILKLIDRNLINGCANITGGGLVDNIKRVIPDGLIANIDLNQI